jgi:hypothetical protein
MSPSPFTGRGGPYEVHRRRKWRTFADLPHFAHRKSSPITQSVIYSSISMLSIEMFGSLAHVTPHNG